MRPEEPRPTVPGDYVGPDRTRPTAPAKGHRPEAKSTGPEDHRPNRWPPDLLEPAR
jgi:hypothetical protein